MATPRGSGGFTLIEVLVAAALLAVLAGVTAPLIATSMRLYALNSAAQSVASTIRGARYSAVSKNRTVRIRFNCPAAKQFRVVEKLGTAADSAADRCSETTYPYPDPDAAVAPNVDGPIVSLPSEAQFGALQDLEIGTDGRVTPLTGCPGCVAQAPPGSVVISNGNQTRTITISANGQIVLP